MFDFLSSLNDVMSFNDIIPPSINIHAKSVVRFKSQGICKDDCCYYIIFYNQIGALFGCWRRDIYVKWFAKSYHKLSYYDKAKYQQQIERFEKEKKERKEIGLLRCKKNWELSQEPDEKHDYLIRKKIKPLYCRQLEKNLLIPIFDCFGDIQSIQYISPGKDKNKLYETGTSYKNGYLPLGERIVSPLRLCEGYATGCSIYEAIGAPVFVCFSAFNLIEIAKWIRKKFKDLEIHICADDDRKNENKIGKNIGLISAIKTAKEINAKIVYPDFTNISNAENATDFNDLMCLQGIEAVENQLLNGVLS